MTIENKKIVSDTQNEEVKWNEQMEKDSDVLDMLAFESLDGITDEDFEDEDW